MPIDWNQEQPAPRAVWSLVHAQFPVARSLGIYNPRNVAGTNTPSAHAEGRALDIGLFVNRPSEKLIGDQIFKALIDCAAQSGIDHVIWNQQIWSTVHPVLRRYTGASPHTDHIHLAFTRDGSQQTQFPALAFRLAQIRTGLEELKQAHSNIG